MGYSRKSHSEAFPTSRGEALFVLGTRDSRKLAGNTVLIRDDGKGNPAVKLHATNVVTFTPDGLRLTSGGWRTPTTKDRIGACLPGGCALAQDGGLWSLCLPDKDGMMDWRNRTPYADGMTLSGDGRSVRYAGGRKPDPAAEKKLRKRVADYAANYVKALMAGKVPPPSAGDCFGCALVKAGSTPESRRAEHPSAGVTGADHFLSHLSERYYVPSLAFRALEFAGAGPAIVAAVAERMEGASGGWAIGIAAPILRRSITRYVRVGLGLCR